MGMRGKLAGIGTLFLLLGLLVPAAVSGQTTTPGAGTSTTGGTTINVFCLDFGKKFPDGQSIKAQGLADDKVRGALQYALSKGYIQSDPYQVQLAVWNIADGQPFHDVNNRGTTRAQEIVANTGAAPAGSASDVSNVTVGNLKAADANAAYGTGTVTGSLPANVPVGFLLPASDGTFQRLVSVVASTTGQASATTGTTTTGTTAAGSATTTGTRAAGSATTTTGTTAAGTTAATTAPTATTAATSAATTAPAATVAATTTSAATGTSVATATRAAANTPAPVATGTGGATTMPTTGAPRAESSLDRGMVMFLLAGLLALVAGLAMGLRSAGREGQRGR